MIVIIVIPQLINYNINQLKSNRIVLNDNLQFLKQSYFVLWRILQIGSDLCFVPFEFDFYVPIFF